MIHPRMPRRNVSCSFSDPCFRTCRFFCTTCFPAGVPGLRSAALPSPFKIRMRFRTLRSVKVGGSNLTVISLHCFRLSLRSRTSTSDSIWSRFGRLCADHTLSNVSRLELPYMQRFCYPCFFHFWLGRLQLRTSLRLHQQSVPLRNHLVT